MAKLLELAYLSKEQVDTPNQGFRGKTTCYVHRQMNVNPEDISLVKDSLEKVDLAVLKKIDGGAPILSIKRNYAVPTEIYVRGHEGKILIKMSRLDLKRLMKGQ